MEVDVETATLTLSAEPKPDAANQQARELPDVGGAAYRLAMRILGSPENAEDVVQQAYVVALERLHSGSPPLELRTWFLGVVANLAKLHRRRGAKRREKETAMRQDHADATPCGEDLVTALGGAMAMLDEKYRLPVSLCYEEGLSQREAAAVLQMPERTLSHHVNTGIAKLRKALERAGYVVLPAAVLEGLRQTAPAVPASLAERVETLVSSGAKAVPHRFASTAARKASAAKGGLAMKLVAGVVLAGAVAAGVAVVGGGLGPLGAVPPGEFKDPPPDQVYRMQLMVRDSQKILDGPAGQAETIDVIKGLDVDHAGNWYWAESGYPALRVFRKETGRVHTVAGSTVCGLLDGPLEVARFGGWAYNATNLIFASGDGKHVFLRDAKAGNVWRHIDLDAGAVRTLEPYQGQRGTGHLVIVRDKSGLVYAFRTNGGAVPESKGYTKLKVAPFKVKHHYIGGIDRCALDAEKMRFYWHGRRNVATCDLRTGEVSTLAAGERAKPAPAGKPFAGTRLWCPTGMSISPSGRYLYVGGGDFSTCHRFDLEKKETANLEPAGKGLCRFVPADPARDIKGLRAGWPAAAIVAPGGELVWPGSSASGIFRLVPAK